MILLHSRCLCKAHLDNWIQILLYGFLSVSVLMVLASAGAFGFKLQQRLLIDSSLAEELARSNCLTPDL